MAEWQKYPRPTVCDVCGHNNSEKPWPDPDVCPRCYPEVKEKPPVTACVQDYPGLDAAGFLLVALGHLVKAKEKLDQEPPSRARYNARWAIVDAGNFARRALKILDKQKEETCENSNKS